MISSNIRYYRLKKGISRSALASCCGLSAMAISNYESGERRPSMEIIKKIAEALDVKISDLLMQRNENLIFQHSEFRKQQALTKTEQCYVTESVEEYFNRLFTAVDILGGDLIPSIDGCHSLDLSDDDNENGLAMRSFFNLPEAGPIGKLSDILENKGFLVFSFDIKNERFSGLNGFVSGHPYIAFNCNMSPERNRSTISHELAHILFRWPSCMDDKEKEERATAIGCAFLFPESDVKRELGMHRSAISKDMEIICAEYGISMMQLAKRAGIYGIIPKQCLKSFFIEASRRGWRRNEPSRVPYKEEPLFFKQLVLRAVSEHEISIQKGAELLHLSYETVKNSCFYDVE